MKYKQLINVHAHSDQSLDGASTVKDLVARTIELGASYMAATEHGNLNSAMDVYHTCKDKGIKPILGIELYLEPIFKDEIREQLKIKYPDDAEKVEKELYKEYVHLTVHFKDEWAYHYFTRLTPKMNARAVVKGGETKPMATMEDLAGAAGHITICSSCLIGAVTRWLLPYKPTGNLFDNRLEMAEKAYCQIREIAGQDSFFVEVFPHQLTKNWKSGKYDKETKQLITPGEFINFECSPWFPDGDWQKKCNQVVLDLAKKYGDKVVISLDSHFANESDQLVQNARLGNGQERWKFSNCYKLMGTEEAAEVLKHTLGVNNKTIEEWVDNSYYFGSLFDNFKLTTNKDRWVLMPLPDNWMSQLKQKIDRYGRMDWSNSVMLERLKTEIDVLARNGKINYMSYLFTVEDIANFCKENDILMNVRGSAGGSLLLYLLGVSGVNPLKYNLSFPRFINLGRIVANNPPDVDMDLSNREAVIAYLETKYGDAVCRLSTDAMLRLKSSLRDAERSITGSVSIETENLCKTLPFTPQGSNDDEVVFGKENEHGEHVPGLVDTSEPLKRWILNKPEIWETVKGMLGIQRQKSGHACGVVIADKPVQEYCPIITIDGEKLVGFNPKWVERSGLIKYDLLNLNTLRDMQVCLKSIEQRHGIKLDVYDLPHDENVMAEFALGRTETVFQFGTPTVIPYLMAIKPQDIEGLTAITALCRPGTLDAPYGDGRTLAEVYVARCQGEPIEYIHQDLEPILKDTMGICLYQEITQQIFTDLVGYDDVKADEVRRGIGKKNEKVLRSCMGDLKKARMAKGWTEQQVDLLIEQIMASADYSFNKSHAASYGVVAYACMYLKYHYPLEWWLGCLSNGKKDELVADFWKYVKGFTSLPDIKNAKGEFYIDGDKIVMPISFLSGIGPKMYEQIVEGAPYTDFKDFVFKHFTKKQGTRNSVTGPMVEKLIIAGVMDSLFEKDMTLGDKLSSFLALKAEAREEKLKEQLAPEYFQISPLGKYMKKKELIKIFSDDLRPIMLPARNGFISEVGLWKINNTLVIDYEQINKLRQLSEQGKGMTVDIQCLAYVIDESIINYKNKTKKATKMNVDVNGSFFEEVLWPAWGEDTSPSGFKGQPVLMVYRSKEDRFSLIKVLPLIEKSELSKLSVI